MSAQEDRAAVAEETETSIKEVDEVHSANSWESADLGDQSRNNKFLRLLGAKKKEHHGRFVIGDQDTKVSRPKTDVQHVSTKLEDQFKQSMEHRLVGGKKGHIGLGFHPEEKDEDGKGEAEGMKEEGEEGRRKEGKESEDKTVDVSDGDGKLDGKGVNTVDRKREATEKSESDDSDVKKIKFVSSS